MKKLIPFLFVAILLLWVGEPVYAKSKKDSLSTPHVVLGDSISVKMLSLLRSSTSKLFNDARAPRFVMVDKSSKYLFGIGGFVRSVMFYDSNGIKGPSFVVYKLPYRDASPKSPPMVGLDVSSSRLFFKLLGDTKLGKLEAFIETDFMGANNTLRLTQAYIEFMNIKVGQAWTIYKNTEEPSSIDYQGAISLPSRRLPQVSYTYRYKNMEFQIAAEFSQYSTTLVPSANLVDADIKNVSLKFPDIPITFKYDTEHLHLFAAINNRVMTYPDDSPSVFSERYSFSGIFAGNVNIRKRETSLHQLFFQVNYANGMVDCIQDLDGRGYNMIVDARSHKISIPSAIGGYLGYRFKWGLNEINAQYSYVHLFQGKENYSHSGIYKNGHYAALNYIRQIFKYGTLGVEGVYGYKDTYDIRVADGFRIHLLLRYDF